MAEKLGTARFEFDISETEGGWAVYHTNTLDVVTGGSEVIGSTVIAMCGTEIWAATIATSLNKMMGINKTIVAGEPHAPISSIH